MISIRENLKNKCSFEKIFENRDGQYPACELAYFRCDHDGYRWWTSCWPVNKELAYPDLITEFDSVHEAFIEEFPDLKTLRAYCFDNAQFLSQDNTECNLYLEGEHGLYWFRIILRKGDYNLYLHCFSKRAIE